MYYQLISYLKFLCTSTNAHGVHSPFVYDLVTQCFYKKRSYPAYNILDQLRDKATNNTSTINVIDHGSGSRVFKSDARQVKAIAKHAGISKKRQRLLFRVAHYFSPQNALELGTSIGLGTPAIALGVPQGTIHTVEGCPETASIAEGLFQHFQLSNINLHQSTFETFFLQDISKSFDLVYLDGNHSEENTLTYFNALLPYLHNNSVLILDDIYWSKGMTRAWDQIRQRPEVTVSIDTFQWGFLFFRKEQRKEHFKIRM